MSTSLVRTERNVAIGYLLLVLGFFPGIGGLHRFYAGRWISGIVWLLTGGLCMVGQIVDIFFMPRMIADVNAGRPVW